MVGDGVEIIAELIAGFGPALHQDAVLVRA